jgi:hypothetical protein
MTTEIPANHQSNPPLGLGCNEGLGPNATDGRTPCGECHLRHGERCDVCGAIATRLERWGRGPEGTPHLLQRLPDGYWTPWHLAEAAVAELRELADSEGTRAVQALRRARRAEAAMLTLADIADAVGVGFFDSDDLPAPVQALQFATQHARDVLRHNKAQAGPDEIDKLRDLLHRMLETPTTQISATWKDAARQGLALGPNVRAKREPTAWRPGRARHDNEVRPRAARVPCRWRSA